MHPGQIMRSLQFHWNARQVSSMTNKHIMFCYLVISWTELCQYIWAYRCTHTLTGGDIELCIPGLTDTLKGADGIVARCVFVTRSVGCTLVDVVVTIPGRETSRTLGTATCHVALSVTVTTVAIPKTIFAPRAARTGCMNTHDTNKRDTNT